MEKILLACSEPLFAAGTTQLLQRNGLPKPLVVHDGAEALKELRKATPDLLILDLLLPNVTGLEVLQWLRQAKRHVPVLILAADDHSHFIDLAQQHGAAGYIAKSESEEQLLLAIKAVISGRSHFPSELFQDVSRQAGELRESNQLATLSPREFGVLRQLAAGVQIKAIASTLNLSVSAVSTYKTRIFQKLGLHNSADLIALAWRNGIAQPQGSSEVHAISSKGESLQDLINLLPIATSLRDREGVIIMCNNRHAELHGRTPAQCVGARFSDLLPLEPELVERIEANYRLAIARAEGFVVDIVVPLSQGRRTMRAWGTPHQDSTGQVVGMLFSMIDVTDYDAEVASLTRSQQSLTSLKDLRTHFFLTEGNQFRQQLVRLQAALASNSEGPSADELNRLTESMLNRLDLIRSIVALELGNLNTRPSTEDIALLTRAVVERFKADETSCSVQVIVPKDAVPTWIDAPLYRQFLSSCLSFAAAERSAKLMLRATTRYGSHGKVTWQLEISGAAESPPFDRLSPHLGLLRRVAPHLRASVHFPELPSRLPILIEMQLIAGPDLTTDFTSHPV